MMDRQSPFDRPDGQSRLTGKSSASSWPRAVLGIDAPRKGKRKYENSGNTTSTHKNTTSLNTKVNLTVFMCSLAIPIYFYIGAMRMSPYRVYLVIMFLPLTVKWLTGGCGRVRIADLLLILYLIWTSLAMLVVHGTERIQFIGITTIETFGAYLVARFYVRTPADFEYFVKVLFLLILSFIPAAIVESFSGGRIYNDIFGAIAPTFSWVDYEQRMGMFRAQVVFEHPILYGLFTCTGFSLLYFTRPPDKRAVAVLGRAWVAIVATFFSLSAGPLMALFVQIYLAIYDRITRNITSRWSKLAILAVVAYVAVDILSNRTPFEVFASYMTFNQGTSYWRILIFRYGMENVWAHPLFGIGLNDWVRPAWMHTSSVDNFWLLTAMRGGIPAFFLMASAFFAILWPVGRRELSDPRVINQRKAIVMVIISLIFTLSTVHVWNTTFVYLMYLLGASLWTLDHEERHLPSSEVSSIEPDRAQRRTWM